ncbi:hypothetical protein M569_03851, partial [Genlisea aurea]
LGSVLDLPSLSGFSDSDFSLRRRRKVSLEKKKWVFSKQEQSGRFNHLIRMCAKTFGSDAMLDVFGRLGQETGLKEFSALINACIETAENSTDEDIALEQIRKAYQICNVVKDSGFEISEEMYGKFLLYLIDRGMVEEFFSVHELIKNQYPGSLPRLAYYEMLLWIKVKNETKIQELCHRAMSDDSSENVCLREFLIPALVESNRNQEFLMLLEKLEITRVTSSARLKCIFKALGNSMLESYLERFLLELKSCGTDAETMSSCIYQYTIGMPNVVVNDVVNKFQALHAMLDMLPTASRYEKLIRFFCELLKVYAAIRLLDLAHDSGVTLTLKTFHVILDACDQSCNFNLVHQIHSKLDTHGVQPDLEAFRKATLLYVRMKDFEGAYQMIEELRKLDLKPTASIYNIILGGYFREKKIAAAMNVIKQMEDADVKPDAVTYSYLISFSNSDGIIKYCNHLDGDAGPPLTKHVFMALINAYASSGQIGKAKEVILDRRISGKDLNDIKNVLVAALASNGQLSAALDLYEEIKRDKCHINSKTIKCLIENFDSEEKLNDSLQLLKELNESPYWTCAWFSVMSLCLRYENLSCAVELLNEMKNKFMGAGVSTESLFDEVFCMYAEKEPKKVQFGLSLLEAVKKTINGGPPQVTRKGLDFLLSACVRAKDSAAASLIWKEYEAADLPYNVLSFVRMYQAFLASADKKSAAKLLKKIPKEDPHVVRVLEACRVAYAAQTESPPNMLKKKKKKTKK